MKNQNSPLPPLLLRLFEQIDCCGDDPVIFRQENIATADKALLASTIKQGLLTDGLAQTIACISCDGIAEISRSGPQGKKLTAVCGDCASVFSVTHRDLREYRTAWDVLVTWAASILGTADDLEQLSGNIGFLGSRYIGEIEHEIFLARQLASGQSAEIYNGIAQSLSANKSGIVYSLSPRPATTTNKRLTVMRLSSAVEITEQGVKAKITAIADKVRNPVRQAAGLAKVKTDPAQKQKQLLIAFIRKSITGKFKDMYHHQIKAAILTHHKKLITYQSSDGQIKNLSGQMILDAARAVLAERGLTYWISGKAHRS